MELDRADSQPKVGQRISIRWRGGLWHDGSIKEVMVSVGAHGKFPDTAVTVQFDDGDVFTHDLRTTTHELGEAPHTNTTHAPLTGARKRQKVADDGPGSMPQRQRPCQAAGMPLALLPSLTAALEPRRQLRAPRKRLISIAFVWPESVPWDGLSAIKGRRAPRWYADCITETILHFGRDGNSSFIVHVHGALGGRVIAALDEQWRRAFDSLNARDETLCISVCHEGLHPMYPVAARVVPLLDSKSERVVISLDVHDSLCQQDVEISALLDQMRIECRSAGWTCWAGHGLRSSFKRDDPGLPPPPLIAADRTVQQAEAGVVWHLDCGLLLTLPGFRRALAATGAPSYAQHLRVAHEVYDFDCARGSDEMALELYLLAGQTAESRAHASEVMRLCLTDASLRVHSLCVDSTRGKHGGGLLPPAWPGEIKRAGPPRYADLAPRPRQFVYDEEVRKRALSHGGGDDKSTLRWAVG